MFKPASYRALTCSNSPTDSPASAFVVSDYGHGTWHDERRMLQALAAQDIAEPFEIVLAATKESEPRLPADLAAIAPLTRLVLLPKARSGDLKNEALRFTSGQLVAVLEADSAPYPNWLRLTAEALGRDPAAAAVSGRTIYGRNSVLKRTMALIDRAFIDSEELGATEHVSTSGALCRRELLEAHPFPDEDNAFVAGWKRNDQIKRAGHRVLFHPQALSVHQFSGLRFAADLRRNVAFSDGRDFFLANGASGSVMTCLRLAWDRLVRDWKACRRRSKAYIYWYDWFLLVPLLFAFKFVEWPALRDGVSGKTNLEKTEYH